MAQGKKKPEVARKRRQKSTEADWGGTDADTLRRLIEAVTLDGGAIRFGYSRDGGAYSLGIYGDGKPFTEFCPGDNEVNDWLTGFIEDYS